MPQATAAALTVLEFTSNGLGSDAFAIVWDGKAAWIERLGPQSQGIDLRGDAQAFRGSRRETVHSEVWLVAGHYSRGSIRWWSWWTSLPMPLSKLVEPAANTPRRGIPFLR